jgi:membrane dipeptidase
MVTFVPPFVSAETAKAYKELQPLITERTASITDPVEKEKAQKEIRDAHPLPKATLAQVADHVEYVRKVAGIDHVGLGSDFDGIDEGPVGLEDVSRYPYLFAELMKRGWSDEDLRKLAGLNVLRVLRKAEEVAKRLQATRPASVATIEQLDGAAQPK